MGSFYGATTTCGNSIPAVASRRYCTESKYRNSTILTTQLTMIAVWRLTDETLRDKLSVEPVKSKQCQYFSIRESISEMEMQERADVLENFKWLCFSRVSILISIMNETDLLEIGKIDISTIIFSSLIEKEKENERLWLHQGTDVVYKTNKQLTRNSHGSTVPVNWGSLM